MDHSPKVWGDFQFSHRCLKIHNVPPPEVLISLNIGTFFQNALNSNFFVPNMSSTVIPANHEQ